MSEEIKKGCVVFMKASSGLVGYGNAQCVSGVHGPELGTISLYGHNQHYKASDIDKIVEFPEICPEILALAKTMQYKLNKNKHKECGVMNPGGKGRGWEHCENVWLWERMQDEADELLEILGRNRQADVLNECADIANFAMMIHDNTSKEITLPE